MKSLPDIIKVNITNASPPLWDIWGWVAFQTFGTSEIVIRSLALLFFAGTIFFTYLIGKLLWSKKTGMLAGLLTALNPFLFIYAFEGGPYSILALGVTASMYFFLRIMRERNSSSMVKVWYVIATAWALYSHHFAIFALMIQAIWFLYIIVSGRKTKAKRIFKLFIAVGILYLPWIYPLYLQSSKVGGGFLLTTPDIYDLRTLFYDYLAQGIKTKKIEVPFIKAPLHEVALWTAFAVLILRKWHKKIKSSLFLLTWFVGPILLTWLLSQVSQSISFNKYLLYTIPAAMILVASGRRKISIYVIGLLLISYTVIDFYYFTNSSNPPFREMSEYVKSTKFEGDFLINWNSGPPRIWETMYYGINAPIYIPDGGELPFFAGKALLEEGDSISTLPNVDRIGVVTSGSLDGITMPIEFVG